MKDTMERIEFLKYKIRSLSEDIVETMELRTKFIEELNRLEKLKNYKRA